MQVCKGLSSLWRCDQVTQPKAPLNSAVIYPITRSPNNHLETGKRKNLARPYLCLAHPAWSWWWCLMLHSSRNASLDQFAPWRHIICSPIHHYGIASLSISSHVHYHQMDGKLQAYDPLGMLILNLPNSTLMMITTWSHPLMGYMKSHFWCKPMVRYLTHIDNTNAHIWWVSS